MKKPRPLEPKPWPAKPPPKPSNLSAGVALPIPEREDA